MNSSLSFMVVAGEDHLYYYGTELHQILNRNTVVQLESHVTETMEGGEEEKEPHDQ